MAGHTEVRSSTKYSPTYLSLSTWHEVPASHTWHEVPVTNPARSTGFTLHYKPRNLVTGSSSVNRGSRDTY